jgi:hypothetical protein
VAASNVRALALVKNVLLTKSTRQTKEPTPKIHFSAAFNPAPNGAIVFKMTSEIKIFTNICGEKKAPPKRS